MAEDGSDAQAPHLSERESVAATVYGLLDVAGSVIGISIADISEVLPLPALSPMAMNAHGLLGAFDLRGRLIPLFDLHAISGRMAGETTPSLVAVLRSADRCLAIGIDEILGIAHMGGDAVQRLSGGATASERTGGFLHEGRIVTLVDVRDLLAAPGVHTAHYELKAETYALSDGRAPVLVFAVGGATFAVKATEVHGTVPKRVIDRNSLTSGHCLGSITQHGRRIPVLDTPQALGIGRWTDLDAAEIVVLRYPEDRLLGFAVDKICRLITVDAHDVSPPPGALGTAAKMLVGTLVDDESQQVFLLKPEALRARPDLLDLARMSERMRAHPDTAPRAVPADAEAAHAVIQERVRYLIFEIGGRTIASPIAQVVRLVEPPDRLVEAPGAQIGVEGFFPLDGQTVPLVRPPHYAASVSRTALSRVLLLGRRDRFIGLAVDAVLGIETSVWRTPPAPDVPENDGIAQLGNGETRRILPRLDLSALAERYGVPAADVPAEGAMAG